MKKLILILLYLVVLSSVFALRTCWSSGDPAKAATDYHSVSTEPQIVARRIDEEPMNLWEYLRYIRMENFYGNVESVARLPQTQRRV